MSGGLEDAPLVDEDYSISLVGGRDESTTRKLRPLLFDTSGNVKTANQGTQPISGTVTANQGTAGSTAWPVKDDFDSFEAKHQTLAGSTDTTITFAQAVRLVQIANWDVANRVLVKDGAITSDSDSSAARVGKAPASDVPGKATFPFVTTSVHLRASTAVEVTVVGYF